MAAGDISIRLNADSKAFKQGVENGVIQPLEDAEKALEELGRTRGPEQLERDMRDAQRSTEQLEDELGEARRELDKLGFAARDAGRDGQAGLGQIKGGAKEVQQEIGQNLGETVASFRGDLSDLGQIGQDTLGGLAATIAGAGPAGLLGALALAAGALGLGAVTAGMDEAKEKQEALNEAAAKWAEAYEASAGRIVAATSIVSEVNAIATDPERYKEAGDNARNWGVDVSAAMLAMSGDATALGVVQESLNGKQKAWAGILSETKDRVGQVVDPTAYMTDEQRKLGDELKRGQEQLDLQTEAMSRGQEQAQNAARALHDYATRVGEATGETDDLGNAIVRLPDGKEIVVDANTKTAYEDLDAIENRKLAEKTIPITADTSAFDAAVSRIRNSKIRVDTLVARPGGTVWQ